MWVLLVQVLVVLVAFGGGVVFWEGMAAGGSGYVVAGVALAACAYALPLAALYGVAGDLDETDDDRR